MSILLDPQIKRGAEGVVELGSTGFAKGLILENSFLRRGFSCLLDLSLFEKSVLCRQDLGNLWGFSSPRAELTLGEECVAWLSYARLRASGLGNFPCRAFDFFYSLLPPSLPSKGNWECLLRE